MVVKVLYIFIFKTWQFLKSTNKKKNDPMIKISYFILFLFFGFLINQTNSYEMSGDRRRAHTSGLNHLFIVEEAMVEAQPAGKIFQEKFS